MRAISLSDGSNALRSTALAELDILHLYPEDEVSREQAMTLLHHEWKRWKDSSAADFEFSTFTLRILEAAHKNIAHRVTCGLVALSMQVLEDSGADASLERAADHVSKFASDLPSLRFKLMKRLDFAIAEKPIPVDVPTIKRHFRAYRSVSHICAMHLVAGLHFSFQVPFEERMEINLQRFATVIEIQKALSKVHNFDDWNLWTIKDDVDFDRNLHPALKLPEDWEERLRSRHS